ncbi:ATP-binding protein [Bacteroides sp.]
MKNLTIPLLIFLLFSFTAGAQTSEMQQYDSIMSIMKDSSLPLMERYYMTGDIENLSREHQIEVLKQLVPEAKMWEDKAVITRLYSIISLSETQLSHMEAAKNYLDSAFVYEGTFTNNNISGMMYYAAGVYHVTLTDFVEAQKNYYKAAEYFNKNEQKPGILTDVFYNLSIIYILWQDEKGLAELMKDMEQTPVDFPVQQILKLSVQAQYYYVRYTRTENAAYLDSATVYNNMAFDVYNKTDNPYDVGHQISDNYLSQALIYCFQGKIPEAKKCFEIGRKLMNPKQFDSDARILYISGLISYYLGDYQQAEDKLQTGLKLLESLSEEKQINYDESIISSYLILAKVYEEKKLYDKALEAERQSVLFSKRLYEQNTRKEINTLRVKYNLDQAERSVKQLTALNEQRARINLLAIGMVVLALVVIFLLVIRHRSRQKLNAHLLQIAGLKQQEADLTIKLQNAKLEEKEIEFQAMVSEAQQRRVQYYLEGLEVERNRLARELHDNVSNELVAIRMKIEGGKSTPEEVMDTLKALHTEVRSISHELMPPVFKYATLPEILEDYVSQRNQPEKTQVTLSILPEEGWEDIPQNIGLEIYRIIQEVTGNALKHAEANRIDITLLQKEGKIKITVSDNGKGFDKERRSTGIGMNIIQERVRNLKGQLMINTAPGKGTEVIVELLTP